MQMINLPIGIIINKVLIYKEEFEEGKLGEGKAAFLSLL